MTVLKIKEWLHDEESKCLILNRGNLQLWKKVLDETMFNKAGFDKYSECLWDENWLEAYIGMTPYAAVMEEMENWED